MNYLWGIMIVIGVIFGAFHGGFGQITEAAVASAKEAVSLAIAMAGVIAMWTGLMEIAQETGMLSACTKRLRPLLKFLFPGLPQESRANELIATNFIANIFGLGWAATPAGLEAMQELKLLSGEKKETASREMCTFLVLNISSLQLIPVNMIAYRSQYGSVNPAAIVGPGIVATLVSTLTAIILCKVMCGGQR
ncbi:MAG: nucleoside recognition protein [bacterium]|nr:nucleoside recognition protein [bacterium]MDY4100063.1 nucleoside recognition protein [Lachnospiraceae bacterium]